MTPPLRQCRGYLFRIDCRTCSKTRGVPAICPAGLITWTLPVFHKSNSFCGHRNISPKKSYLEISHAMTLVHYVLSICSGKQRWAGTPQIAPAHLRNQQRQQEFSK